MNWMEVIRAQIPVDQTQQVCQELNQLVEALREEANGFKIRVYHNLNITSDLAVYLWWQSEKPDCPGSKEGLRVLDYLARFGMVNHSIWKAIDKNGEYQ